MRVFNGVDELRAAVGTQLGVSDWHTVDQSQIDTFADATLDHQWIHVDADKAKARDHLLGLFAAVGNDDPRVLAGRRNLASALF